MAWKEIDPDTWKAEKAGDNIEGKYVGMEPGTDDMSARYYVENETGIRLVWGSAVLDQRMKFLQLGQQVKIEFKGIEQNSKGRDMRIYKVYYEEEAPTVTEEKLA